MSDVNEGADRDDTGREGAGIPTDARGGGGGVGSVEGVAGVGIVSTSFGAPGNVPEPPGVEEEPVTMEDEDDPDAIAHGDRTD